MLLALRSLALPLLLCLAVTSAATEADARRSQCKKRERRVVKGSAAYGGPALGFEVTYVFPSSRCVDVLRTTADGSFALVAIEDGRVGWVATGLVEADLSEEKGAKPAPVASPYEVLAVRDTSLRKHPRFDARVLTTVHAKAKLQVTGTSPDGLWLYVESKGEQGWVSRYQVAVALPAEKSPPTAGDGAWTIRGPRAGAAPPRASVERAQAEGGDEKGDGGKQEGALPDDGSAAPADAAAAAAGPRLLGRGQEISFAISVGQWSQTYASDAQGDAFYKYDLSSTGPAGTLSYAYRGDFPLVADAQLNLGLFGFDLAPPGAPGEDPIYTSVFHAALAAHVGWRLHGDEIVDVEAGLGSGLSVVWIGDIEVAGTRVDAFTPGVYLDAVRPYVAARTRLAGGALGLVSLEAAVPLGGYLMVYDPGTKYLDDYDGVPVLDVPKPRHPDAEAADGEAEPPVMHPAVGVEARLRYAFPLGDVVRLRASLGIGARQAFIGGPGVRASGIYTEATNIDFLGSFDLGADFSF